MVQLFKKVSNDSSRLFKKAGETSNKLFKKGGSVEKAVQNIGSVVGSVGKRARLAGDLVDVFGGMNPETQAISAGLRGLDMGAQQLKKVSKVATSGGNSLERAQKVKDEGNKINFA